MGKNERLAAMRRSLEAVARQCRAHASGRDEGPRDAMDELAARLRAALRAPLVGATPRGARAVLRRRVHGVLRWCAREAAIAGMDDAVAPPRAPGRARTLARAAARVHAALALDDAEARRALGGPH